MNFKDACKLLIKNKQVRRRDWGNCGWFIDFHPNGYLQTPAGIFLPTANDAIAKDWEIYGDPNYKIDHNWDWARIQMEAGNTCRRSHCPNAAYTIKNEILFCASKTPKGYEPSSSCGFGLSFLDDTWGLHPDPPQVW